MIPFPATQRSVLERIRSGDAGVRQLAFGDLAQGYWKPSYHYLRLHWRLGPEAAEDAVSCGCRKEADQHLHRAGELARRSLSEARRSVHALRPQALQEHNLWNALKGTIKNTTVGTALRTTFAVQGKPPSLPQPWQENLLHIGQEALTNTLKYAHARNFETRLSYKSKKVSLELRDDGDGFNVRDRHDGVGLAGMRERVEQMGGELKITSSRGKGTKITVLLPCNGEAIP